MEINPCTQLLLSLPNLLEWKFHVEKWKGNLWWLSFSMNTNGKQCSFTRVDAYVDDVKNKACARPLPLLGWFIERKRERRANINHTSIRLSSWHFAAIMTVNCETSVGKNAYVYSRGSDLSSFDPFLFSRIWLKGLRKDSQITREKIVSLHRI